ncbi:MAG: DUF1743 domain-containing protein [Sulfolobales archaeon]
MVSVHIGFDDSDEFVWGCTTNLVREFVKEISLSSIARKIRFIDYPLLTRLNPAIPYKTRGNGATSIHIEVETAYDYIVKELEDIIIQKIDEGKKNSGRDPGALILVGDLSIDIARYIYRKTLSDYVTRDIADRIIMKIGGITPARGRGVIGALASIAHHFIEGDCTYELLGYTLDSEWEGVEREKVYEMDRKTWPYTFNNIDRESDKILITPSVGRPVSIGIRGENPRILLKAFEILQPRGVDEIMIFRSNQGTDHHMIYRDLRDVRPYQTGLFEGVLAEDPEISVGGDVFLRLIKSSEESEDKAILVAVYKELGEGNMIVRNLRRGDKILVGGSVKPMPSIDRSHDIIVNVELLKVVEMTSIYIERNPRCPRCGHTMKSMGRDKGYKCPRCGYIDKKIRKSFLEVGRDKSIIGKIYRPPPRYMKHLSKPPQRYGLEKICSRRTLSRINIDQFYRRIT